MKALLEKIGMLKWLWVTAVFVGLDQLTKQLAEASLTKYNPVEVISHLNLYLAYNTGAAFSFLSDQGDWARYFFTFIALGVSIVLIYWIKSLKPNERLSAFSLALILSGAFGNLIDRVLFGHVIDFIQFYYHADSCLPGFAYERLRQTGQCIWPSFNVADSAIFVGAAILIVLSIKDARNDWRNNQEKIKQANSDESS